MDVKKSNIEVMFCSVCVFSLIAYAQMKFPDITMQDVRRIIRKKCNNISHTKQVNEKKFIKVQILFLCSYLFLVPKVCTFFYLFFTRKDFSSQLKTLCLHFYKHMQVLLYHFLQVRT